MRIRKDYWEQLTIELKDGWGEYRKAYDESNRRDKLNLIGDRDEDCCTIADDFEKVCNATFAAIKENPKPFFIDGDWDYDGSVLELFKEQIEIV